MPTTTSHLQKKPDYYNTLEECKNSNKVKVNTNGRYRDFNQTHFTAGDTDQFNEYRDMTNGDTCQTNIELGNNKFNEMDFSKDLLWVKYEHLNAICVDNTFNYMFNKFKKGIFVKIQNNELKVFLPFSKKSFVNEWGNRIKIDPKYGNMYNFVKYTNSLIGKKYRVSVNKYSDNWYSNNCLIRSEFPINEGDTNVPNMSSMLKELCANREVPDMEFFINRRDFPIMKKNNTEAYDHMFGDNHRLVSHEYDKYSPILSMVTTDDYSDIPIPTGDDWSRIYSNEGKYSPNECKSFPNIDVFDIKWANKKPTAVFRGASTGCGVTVDTNIRLKLAYLSTITPIDEDGPLLDAGITKWQVRPRKLKGEKYIQTINVPYLKSLGVKLVPFLSPKQQSEYKYLVHVDGHVSAFRLSFEMSMGCCILLSESKYRLWFRHMLKPMVHYIPVKDDLSDLVEKIRWCRKNDNVCKNIAKNSRLFYIEFLQKDGVLDYLQKLLVDLKKQTGVYLYNNETPLQIQLNFENKHNNTHKKYPKTTKKLSDINESPSKSRFFSVLKAFEWIINMINDKSNSDKYLVDNSKFIENIFSNKAKTIFVNKYSMANYIYAIKSTKDKIKEQENIHELFIGLNVINELVKYVPNFMYIFGKYDNKDAQNNIIIEYIPGQTFEKWLYSDKFNMQDYLFILIQLSLALEFSQRNAGFVHYDLTPWNIIIQELPVLVSFDYMLDKDNIFRVNTKYVPIIIDYGKSHVVYNKKHFGYIKMFEMSTIQDIISILLTSVNIISKRKTISGVEAGQLVKISNFISGTGYRRKKFIMSGNKGVSDIQYFCSKANKYNTLISSDKHELEKRTPLDFITYIRENFKYNFLFIKLSNVQPDFKLNNGNPMQVFDFLLSQNTTERIRSFTDVFDRIFECDISLPTNIFYTYYTSQTFEHNISCVYNNMKMYLNANGIDIMPYKSKYDKTLQKIKNYFVDTLKTEEIVYNIPTLNNVSYNSKTFLLPELVLSILKTSNKKMEDLSEYKLNVELVLLNKGMFKLSKQHLKYYLDNFNTLLLYNDNTNMKRCVANNYTIYKVSEDIYKKNLQMLENKNCKNINEYTDIYTYICNYIKK